MEIDRTSVQRALRRLRRTDLPIDTFAMARFLIGKVLVHDVRTCRLSARIVESEAYPVGDSAGHAFRGKTPRNASLFLEPGHAYVYRVYGSCFMLNVTSEPAGIGAGVLLRAAQPLDGIERMQRYRGTERLIDLARGPGRLAEAMAIDLKCDGLDLCARGSLWLADTGENADPVGASPRIGLNRERHRILRFYERGNPYVSGPKSLNQ